MRYNRLITMQSDSWFWPRDWPRIEAAKLERDGTLLIVHAYATDQASGELVSHWHLSLYNRAERHVFFNVLRRDKDTSGVPLYANPPAVCISCVFWRAQRAGKGN